MSTSKEPKTKIKPDGLDLDPEAVKDLEPPSGGPTVQGGARSTGGCVRGV